MTRSDRSAGRPTKDVPSPTPFCLAYPLDVRGDDHSDDDGEHRDQHDEGNELATFEGALTESGAMGTYRDRNGQGGEWQWTGLAPALSVFAPAAARAVQ